MLVENQKTVNELQLVWNEKFAFLSELKTNNERRQKVNEWQVYYSPIFEKMDKGTIISLINEYVVGQNQFVVGQPVTTDAHDLYENWVNKKEFYKPTHQDFKDLKKHFDLKNSDIAEIIDLTVGSVKNQTQPSKELPSWAKAMIYIWKKQK